MARHQSLADAIAELVHDGDTVALEGFTHLIPFAAGHEIIRQGRRDLTLVRMTPGPRLRPADRRRLRAQAVFSWGGNPGVGSLHRFRDAVENGWPAPLEIEEHSHAGHGQPLRRRRLRACRSRSCAATPAPTCPTHTTRSQPITCPFTGEELTAVPALNPDVAIIHAQRADRAGQRQLWGITGVQKEAVLGADALARHRRGDRRRARAAAAARSCCRRWVVDRACAEVPGGAQPVLRAGLLRARQRLLPGVGRDQPRPRRASSAWLRRARAATGCRMSDDRPDRRRDDDRRRRPRAARRHVLLRRHRPAQHRRRTSPAARTPPTSCWSTSPGTIGAKPPRLPLSIGDGDAGRDRRRRSSSVPEIFNYWLQPGRIDVGFLGAAQIDRFGNINTTVIGDYDAPEGPAARRRRRAGDRRLLRRGDRRSCGTARARSSSGSTSSPRSGTATARATASGSACAARARRRSSPTSACSSPTRRRRARPHRTCTRA